jgi:hypothetical protein
MCTSGQANWQRTLSLVRDRRDTVKRVFERNDLLPRPSMASSRAALREGIQTLMEGNEHTITTTTGISQVLVELAAMSDQAGEVSIRNTAMRLAVQLRSTPTRPNCRKCDCGCTREPDWRKRDGYLIQPVPNSVRVLMRSDGSTLDPQIQRALRHIFARDTSRIRVHRDRPAAIALRDIGAAAAAFGEHITIHPIFYGSGILTRLDILAHEVAHVFQQDTLTGLIDANKMDHDPGLEDEAEQVGEHVRRVGSALPFTLRKSSAPVLRCQDLPYDVMGRCGAIGCPMTVPTLDGAGACFIADCEALGMWPPVLAKSWCTYNCPSVIDAPLQAAWLIITYFGTCGPFYTS